MTHNTALTFSSLKMIICRGLDHVCPGPLSCLYCICLLHLLLHFQLLLFNTLHVMREQHLVEFCANFLCEVLL